MADRSFEEQVRQELSSLRMVPDGSVWHNVEAELRKEKKRRWLIWFFLFACITGAFVWGYYRMDDTKQKAVATNNQKIANPVSKAIPLSGKSKTTANRTNTIPAAATTKSDIRVQKSIEETATTVSQIDMRGKVAVQHKGRTSKVYQINVRPQVRNDHTEVSRQSVPVPENTPAKTSGVAENKNAMVEPPKETNALSVTQNPGTENIQKQSPVPGAVRIDSTDPKDSVAKPMTISNKKKNNRWQWSVGAEFGSSGLQNELISFAFQKDAAQLSTALPGNGNQGFPGTTTAPAPARAFAFSLNVEARKQLGKKHWLGLYAGYSMFSTSMKVGKRVDSVFSSSSAAWSATGNGLYSAYYYRTSDSTQYVNHYHFLQTGANLYTPFHLFGKIKFQWQLGAGLDLMIASNGLHYDPATNKLFSNNALYTKVQAYASTGIDMAFGKEPFLFIGPHVQYHFGKLVDRNDSPQHFLFSSIKVSFVLPGKKK